MKNKIIIGGLLAIIIGSCNSPEYLPSVDKIDVNQYGSHIRINNNNKTIAEGELIAIDSSEIVVLTGPDVISTKKCVIVPVKEIHRFKLSYAKPKHYGWTIPLYTLATLSHGFFLMFTAPVNLIVTVSATSGGENAFTYSDKEMTYEKLKMFARFPQGIPQDVGLADIK
jgi:hypothetical protein